VDVFSDVQCELRAVREAAAMIDMSPLAKYEISGPSARRFVDRIITRNAEKLDIGQVYYTPWCDENGNIVSDGMVFRPNERTYRITGDPCQRWLEKNAGGLDVEIRDVTHERGILSLQGPKSCEVLELASNEEWSDLGFSRVRSTKLRGVEVEVARQGFTGERGYELCVASEGAVVVWDALWEAGKGLGLRPAGLRTHDVARIEAGLIIPGPDYTKGGVDDERGSAIEVDAEHMTSPYQEGLGRLVDLDHGGFVGEKALRAESESGPCRRRVGLLIDWRDIAALFADQNLPPVVVPVPQWYPSPVYHGDDRIGRATSIAWSSTAGSIIGFGVLTTKFCGPGTRLSVEFPIGESRARAEATVCELPFVKLRRGD